MRNKTLKNVGMNLAKKVAETQMGKGNQKLPPICGVIFYQPKRPDSLKKEM